jgi:1-deoxy-D-xylulose-5-phosphate reductoisomerase
MPAVLNGANECAVEAFIGAEIGFNDISPLIQKVLERHTVKKDPTLDAILAADRWAREEMAKAIIDHNAASGLFTKPS